MGSNNGQRIQTTKTQQVFKVTYFGASDLKLKGFRALVEVKLIVCRHVGSDTLQLDSLFYLSCSQCCILKAIACNSNKQQKESMFHLIKTAKPYHCAPIPK